MCFVTVGGPLLKASNCSFLSGPGPYARQSDTTPEPAPENLAVLQFGTAGTLRVEIEGHLVGMGPVAHFQVLTVPLVVDPVLDELAIHHPTGQQERVVRV